MSNTETTGGVDGGASTSGGGGAVLDDIFKRTTQIVDELYDVHDNFYSPNPVDKLSRMKELIISALQILDSIPEEILNFPRRCATYEYLKGKILNSVPPYKQEVEDHLTIAVKLNPLHGDAWLCLGHCLWKKQEKMVARNCMMLALSKAPSKRVLCKLSTLERSMAHQSLDCEVVRVLAEESIKHARAALDMDVKDGYSWFCLGNALLNSFFETRAWNFPELGQSLKAYLHAEKDAKMQYNPYLPLHSARANRYLENYDVALNGFEAAAQKGNPKANQEIRKMVELFDKMGMYFNAQIRAKEISSLKSSSKSSLLPSLDAVKLDPPYKRATLDTLQEGVNKECAIVGKFLLQFDNKKNIIPLYYALVDSKYQCYILTVYGTQAYAIKEGDQVTILDPCYRHQDFAWKEKHYMFETLRVDFLVQHQVHVNGKALSHGQIQRSIFGSHRPL